MKSKTLTQNKVNIITLGCSKNLVDSEMLSGQLLANEIEVCLLYTSPSPRDRTRSRMPSSA